MEMGAGLKQSRRKGSRRAGGHYTTNTGQCRHASSAAPLCPRQNPNNPCDRQATAPTRPSGCKLDGSAAIQQERYDARWGKRTMSKEFVAFQLAPPMPTAVLDQPAGVGALTAVSSFRWKHDILTNRPLSDCQFPK
jgi:hypothetical protein